jgi:acyl-CoA synthetase (AMP-forming)/AMP-acid ligase II
VGAKGELLVKGPTIISGYYNNPAANKDSFDSEGYFKTGDIVSCGRIPEELAPGQTPNETAATAKWYILDRKKELIKVRGFQVSPAELEKVILQHPAIVDAAVIGVSVYRDATNSAASSRASGKDGELPRAYVVLGPGRTATEEEVKKWCTERLAKYKSLTGGVRFMDALPRNATGKVLKRALREQVAKELASDQAGRRNTNGSGTAYQKLVSSRPCL